MIICKTNDLKAFCASLLEEEYIAVDTEFMRTSTYWPTLCLVQIASAKQAVAIDVLDQHLDLTPLKNILKNPHITKVFHSARQDLEAINYTFDTLPCNIMDTQIMAAFSGYDDCIGYDNLVMEICDVHIDKSSQFTNWQKRPLSDKQINYAIDDVIHLRHAYITLYEELEKRQRYKWAIEEIDKLLQPKLYENDLDNIWLKVRIKSTNPLYLARLKELAKFREQQAMQRNRTRQHIIKDEVLSDIALKNPLTKKDLYNIKGFPNPLKNAKKTLEILEAIKKANAMPDNEQPQLPINRRKDESEKNAFNKLRTLLEDCANKAEINKSLVATKKDLERYVKDQNDAPFMHGWRLDVFGNFAKKLYE